RHVRVRDRPRRRTALDPPTRWLPAPDGGFHPWCAAAVALRRRHAFNTVARVSEAHPGPGRLGEPGVGVPSCVAAAPDAAFGLIRATRSGWRIMADFIRGVRLQPRYGDATPSTP